MSILKNGNSTFKYLKEVFHSILQTTKTTSWILNVWCRIHHIDAKCQRWGLLQKFTAGKKRSHLRSLELGGTRHKYWTQPVHLGGSSIYFCFAAPPVAECGNIFKVKTALKKEFVISLILKANRYHSLEEAQRA